MRDLSVILAELNVKRIEAYNATGETRSAKLEEARVLLAEALTHYDIPNTSEVR